MSLSQEDVRAIAEYARIALDENELAEMTDYMNEAIELLEPIRQYELEGVAATSHPIGGLENVMAPDVVDLHDRTLPIERALGNAGSHVGRSFRVPSILGDEEEGH